MRRLLILGLVLTTCWLGVAIAEGPKTTSRHMPFDTCIVGIASAIEKFKIRPEHVKEFINTPTLVNAKICTTDGHYIMTCSKADETLTTTRSSERCK